MQKPRQSLGFRVVATADTAKVRFHGRYAETWEARGITSAERFRYEYVPSELEEWVPRISSLLDESHDVHAMMNSCYADHGIRSAGMLADLLTEGLG
jgi:uncharacterized protein YecE (DUF72 family)